MMSERVLKWGFDTRHQTLASGTVDSVAASRYEWVVVAAQARQNLDVRSIVQYCQTRALKQGLVAIAAVAAAARQEPRYGAVGRQAHCSWQIGRRVDEAYLSMYYRCLGPQIHTETSGLPKAEKGCKWVRHSHCQIAAA